MPMSSLKCCSHCNATKIQNDAKHERCSLTSRIQANNAPPTATQPDWGCQQNRGWTPTTAKNPHRQCQCLHWSVAVIAALAAANDGRDPSVENRQDKREREPAWPRACDRQIGDTSRRCSAKYGPTLYHYGRSSGLLGTRENQST